MPALFDPLVRFFKDDDEHPAGEGDGAAPAPGGPRPATFPLNCPATSR